MKRVSTLLLALLMVISLTGCSKVPSLNRAVKYSVPDLNDKLVGLSMDDITKAWGEPDSELYETYGFSYDVPKENSEILLYCGEDGIINQVVIFQYLKEQYDTVDTADTVDTVDTVEEQNTELEEVNTNDIKDSIINKTFMYEKYGIGGDFTISINEDETFEYYEGLASSYIGTGTWILEDSILTLSDDVTMGYGLVNHFRVEDSTLVFIEEDSSNFTYVEVADGERFIDQDTLTLKPLAKDDTEEIDQEIVNMTEEADEVI